MLPWEYKPGEGIPDLITIPALFLDIAPTDQ